MPWLDIKKKKRNTTRRNTSNRKARNQIYQTNTWKKLRDSYIKKNPLCEFCQDLGIVKEATDVHHKDSYLNYNDDERYAKAFDPDNLMSLCREHHNFFHRNGSTRGYNKEEEIKEWNKRNKNGN